MISFVVCFALRDETCAHRCIRLYGTNMQLSCVVLSRADEFSLEQCPRSTVRHLFAESDADFQRAIGAREAEASEQLARNAQRLQLFARRLVPVFIHFGKHTSSSTLRCASAPHECAFSSTRRFFSLAIYLAYLKTLPGHLHEISLNRAKSAHECLLFSIYCGI